MPVLISYSYPSMAELAEQIEYIADHFQYVNDFHHITMSFVECGINPLTSRLSNFICLGVGVGANIVARYAVSDVCFHFLLPISTTVTSSSKAVQ